MTKYDIEVRYDVFGPDGLKIGEVVKGVLYQGAPDYRERVGEVGLDEELAFYYEGARFELRPQVKVG
ncbi:hypothetical protein [Pseudomonas guariconensis]|uniref:Uncharacterized protein n=1 Tax=Pseudomonas guariconensis TaxID=1288410 RepID=A0AAX0VQX6_9PSED|nr:hypothetical protein [Pseudomonas guariconensis]PLV12575.1 hypothetical protein CXG49_25420 [Pseudomonas guariconensis]PLV20887.1 hypothetical protein CXG53_25195 [Pseudomonas guariconensis]PLV26516.1 hypothetical protein CXG51_25200 [Pseudomonas guariconensis]